MPTSTMPPCLKAALDYLSWGWFPIPLYPYSKRPIWSNWQQQRPSAEQLVQAWQHDPLCNVGLVMGQAGGLFGIDIDGEAGHRLWAEWCAGRDPGRGLQFTTPNGGLRILYRYPEGHDLRTRSYKVNGKEAIKILSNGSQTAAPPSHLYVSTKQVPYGWLAGYSLEAQ